MRDEDCNDDRLRCLPGAFGAGRHPAAGHGRVQGQVVARYTFPLGGFDAHVQGALAYKTKRASALNVDGRSDLGDIPSSTFLDLAFGIENDKYAIEIFIVQRHGRGRAAEGVDVECATGVCGDQAMA